MADNTNSVEKNYTLKDLKNGKYEVVVKVPADVFEKSYTALVDKTVKTVKMDGFRPGAVPKSVVEERMKDQLLGETFEKLVPTMTWLVLGTEKLEPIMPVKYTSLPEKMELGKDISYTIEIITLPAFKLCDIKKISVKKQDTAVTNDELEKTMKTMFDNQKEGITAEKMDDKWATQIAAKYGMKGVTSIEKLKEETKTLLQKQKEQLVETEFNREIVKEGVKASKMSVPQDAIDYEAHEREHSFMHQLEDAGLKLDEYLQQYNVKIEELEEAWKKDAKEALEEHFFLNKYAESKELQITQDEFNAFLKSLNPTEQMLKNAQWVDSIKSLFFKNKAFSELIKEVKANLGIEEKPKNKIEFAS
jgi:FKBP-type peptidyl-prolyl cis-trans isomerase (trigger factor)